LIDSVGRLINFKLMFSNISKFKHFGKIASSSSRATMSHKKGRKTEKLLPNYFVAIPILNEQIRDKLLEVQNGIVECHKELKSALTPLVKTHITLTVVHLKNAEEIESASNGLKNAVARMQEEDIHEMKLNFEGLGHFGNRVLFARILEDAGRTMLCRTAEIVKNAFIESGVKITDDRDFNAHLTVVKLRKRSLGVKKIDGQCYSAFETLSFGQENCSKLQLLSMKKMDKETGYYECVSELTFSKPLVASDDSEPSVL